MKQLKTPKNKNLKFIILIILVVFLLGTITLILSGRISNLMGNSTLINYSCNDSSYTLKDNKCYKKVIATPIILGDVYNDGIIDNNDKIILSRYISGWYQIDDKQALAADINKDKKIDKNDLNELNNSILKKSNANKNIGQEKICSNDYKLNNDICEKTDIVDAIKK